MHRTQRMAGAVALAAGAGAAWGQCTPAPWATVGGGVTAVAPVSSSFALIGRGTRVEVVTLPATTGTPTVFATRDLGHAIKKISGFGPSAYATDGVRVYRLDRLNAATNPLQLSSTFQPPDIINGFFQTTTTVYTWQAQTLRVIDYTDPANPALIASLAMPAFMWETATFANNRLYITGDSRIFVVDVSNPHSPFLVRTLTTGGSGVVGAITNVLASGGVVRLVYCHNDSTLGSVVAIMDTTETSTTLRGRVQVPSGAVAITSSLLVDGGNPARLYSLNISNPDAPTASLVYSDTLSEFLGFGSINARLLFAGGVGGFTFVDSNTLSGRYRTAPGDAARVIFAPPSGSNTDAYVANWLGGLRVVRVAGGPSASYLGGVDNQGLTTETAVGGGFAFTAGTSGAQCWTISNPAAPTLRSTYNAPSNGLFHLAASGAIVSLVRFSPILQTEALDLVDFAPITPLIRASVPLPAGESTNRVVMNGSLVLRLVAGRMGIYSWTANSLTQRSEVNLGTTFTDAAISGQHAYVLDASGRVSVVDVSSPDVPVHVFTTPLPAGDSYNGVATVGAWLTTVGSRINFYDISDPTRPLLVSSADLACPGTGVAASGTHFIVAEGSCGVQTFEAPIDFEPVITQQPQPVSTCVGGTAVYTIGAITSSNPANPMHYQWQRYVNNTSQNIAGATQPMLVLTNVGPAEAAWGYRCVLSNTCGSATSGAAALRLCYANCDCSTGQPLLNVNDFICFANRFAAGDTYANCDGSTIPPILNVGDFVCFQNQFASGCP